jgi:hypothetical protein
MIALVIALVVLSQAADSAPSQVPLSGRVVGPESQAVEGAEVLLGATGRRAALQRVTTDAEGRFEVPALAEGPLWITRDSPEDDLPRILYRDGASIAAGKLTEIEIFLNGPGHRRTIADRVLDREGRPVASVKVFQTGGPKRTETKTDDQGRFQLPGVPESPAFVFAEKEGYRFQGRPIDTEAGADQHRGRRDRAGADALRRAARAGAPNPPEPVVERRGSRPAAPRTRSVRGAGPGQGERSRQGPDPLPARGG